MKPVTVTPVKKNQESHDDWLRPRMTTEATPVTTPAMVGAGQKRKANGHENDDEDDADAD